jgi:hypothetical protein
VRAVVSRPRSVVRRDPAAAGGRRGQRQREAVTVIGARGAASRIALPRGRDMGTFVLLLLAPVACVVAAASSTGDDSWAPTWLMNGSTIILWRNASGLQPVEDFDGYGVVMLDWANAAQHWINDFSPMNNGAALAEQCEALKAHNPRVKCVVYRNSVKALNQFADVGVKVDDPRYAGFFLPFRAGATSPSSCWCKSVAANRLLCDNSTSSDVHVPMCDGASRSKCNRRLYHDSRQIPHVPGNNWMNSTMYPFENLSCHGPTCNCGSSPCGECAHSLSFAVFFVVCCCSRTCACYPTDLFDHRNSSLREWLVKDYFGGPAALGNPNISGLILDDDWLPSGPTEENGYSLVDMGLSPSDVAHIRGNWSSSLQALNAEVARRGKYVIPSYAGDSMSTRNHNHSLCAQVRPASVANLPRWRCPQNTESHSGGLAHAADAPARLPPRRSGHRPDGVYCALQPRSNAWAQAHRRNPRCGLLSAWPRAGCVDRLWLRPRLGTFPAI